MKRENTKDWPLCIWRLVYIGLIVLLVFMVMWPKREVGGGFVQTESEQQETVTEPVPTPIEEPEKPEEPIVTKEPESYPANRMTHYVMDGNDANTCIAGRWCLGNQLSVANDSSVQYQGYYVYAVHCSVVSEWRGSIIKVYYTDGGVETGIVLDCGGFAGHKDRMDKAMGTRYNGKQDNYTLSRYIEKTEVIRKGW